MSISISAEKCSDQSHHGSYATEVHEGWKASKLYILYLLQSVLNTSLKKWIIWSNIKLLL